MRQNASEANVESGLERAANETRAKKGKQTPGKVRPRRDVVILHAMSKRRNRNIYGGRRRQVRVRVAMRGTARLETKSGA